MNYDIRIMLSIYQTYEYDWLGDKIDNLEKLTKHHIRKKEDGGENGISNYALLTPKSHHFVHLLEEQQPELYDAINNMFLELNRTACPPTVRYYSEIKYLLKDVKKNKKTRR